MEERTVVKVKISEVVNAGAVAYLEGIRGFIPASRLSDEYVEDLKEWDGKTIEAVSYTHLDVYKRQIMALPPFAHGPHFFAGRENGS